MKRNRLMTASIVVMALAAASCGSDAPKTLSEDDFVTEMNSVCRTADRAIAKLDNTDDGYIGDIIDIVQTGYDDLSALTPPKALADDFNDFTANLDDQLTQFGKLDKAVKNEDADAAQTASDKLDKLSADSDDLADSIGASKCVGVGSGSEVTPTTDSVSPDTTEPPTTDAPETTLDTTADTTENTTDDTVTPNTPLPIDTTVDTVTPNTQSGSGVVASDASTEFQPITGYTWGTLEDIPGTLTPTDDAVLGPILQGYYVGVLENSTDGTPVYVYVTVLNQETDWTAEQLDAYYSFELVGDGTDITTPTIGLPGKAKVGVVDGYDGAVFTIKGFGVSLLAPTGTDVPALLDSFAQAQSMGG